MEYNRILKQFGKIYIEVPAPNNDRVHENNLNHYSIFDKTMLVSLLQRAGFDITYFTDIKFDLQVGQNEDGTAKKATEHYYALVAEKKRPLDVK